MVQALITGILVLGAVAYLGRSFYRALRSPASCDTGCGKCGALDVDKIERLLKEKEH